MQFILAIIIFMVYEYYMHAYLSFCYAHLSVCITEKQCGMVFLNSYLVIYIAMNNVLIYGI